MGKNVVPTIRHETFDLLMVKYSGKWKIREINVTENSGPWSLGQYVPSIGREVEIERLSGSELEEVKEIYPRLVDSENLSNVFESRPFSSSIISAGYIIDKDLSKFPRYITVQYKEHVIDKDNNFKALSQKHERVIMKIFQTIVRYEQYVRGERWHLSDVRYLQLS